jgi:hypothetical protein
MKNVFLLLFVAASLAWSSCGNAQSKNSKYPNPPVANSKTKYPMQLSEAEWKNRLTPTQYHILREEGTERAGTGKYDHFDKKGTYYSAASLQPLLGDDTGVERELYPLAEDKLEAAARDGSGLLARAERNTRLMLEGLLRSLGFTRVEVRFSEV